MRSVPGASTGIQLIYDTIAAMMLDGSGTHFHPVLTRNFLRILASRHKDFVPSGGEETPASQHLPSC